MAEDNATSISEDTDLFQDQPITSAFSGCMYATFVIGVSAALLLMNALLCLTVFSAMPQFSNAEIAARVGQVFYFIAPVILLIVEWNLIDRLQRLFSRTD